MSLLRDTKYVKTLSKLTDSGDVMDDACRMILSDVELKLRVVINVRPIFKIFEILTFFAGKHQVHETLQ